MRARLASALILLSFFASCESAATSSSDEEALAGVRTEVSNAALALLEAKNLPDGEAAVGFYSDGPDFTYLGCTEYIVGGETFNGLLAPSYDNRAANAFLMQIVGVRVLGPDAAVVSLAGSTDTQPHLFSTQVWGRTDGRWEVVLEHASWPGCRPPPGAHPFTTPGENVG